MNETNKKEVFNTLNRVTKVINDSILIQKLSHLVEIDFSVVGGAVRDLYLDKSIKDIDIAVRLDFHKNLNVQYPKRINYSYRDDYNDHLEEQSAEADALEKRSKEILNLLGTSEFSIMHDTLLKNDKITAIQAIVSLIQKTLENKPEYSINKVFNDSQNKNTSLEDLKLRDMAYKNIGLCAVISLSDNETKYPIELLFTTEYAENFINCFDFNICKIHMFNKNGDPCIIPSSLFLNDKENTTITYTPITELTEAKMNKSLLVRYERLQKKYPEYTLVSDIKYLNKENQEMVNNTIKAVSLYHQLKDSAKNNLDKKIVKQTSKI